MPNTKVKDTLALALDSGRPEGLPAERYDAGLKLLARRSRRLKRLGISLACVAAIVALITGIILTRHETGANAVAVPATLLQHIPQETDTRTVALGIFTDILKGLGFISCLFGIGLSIWQAFSKNDNMAEFGIICRNILCMGVIFFVLSTCTGTLYTTSPAPLSRNEFIDRIQDATISEFKGYMANHGLSADFPGVKFVGTQLALRDRQEVDSAQLAAAITDGKQAWDQQTQSDQATAYYSAMARLEQAAFGAVRDPLLIGKQAELKAYRQGIARWFALASGLGTIALIFFALGGYLLRQFRRITQLLS